MKRTFLFYTLIGLALTLCAILFGLALTLCLNLFVPAVTATAPTSGPGDAGLAFMMAGMLINKETLGNLFISLKTVFNNAFDGAPTTWEKIATLVTSTTGQNDYAWLSKFPKMRKWIGEKSVKALEAFKYTVKNDDWEATVEVDRNDIDDDNLGIYAPQAKMAGESAKQLPDEIVYDLVNAGMTTLCYDGQNFFDTDHPVKQADGSITSVSNKGFAKLSCATLALAQASLGNAEVALMEMNDDEGRNLGVKGNLLLVPPALKATANTLVTTDRLEDGKPNPFKGAFEVVVDGRLASKTAWYLLDTTKAIKPFIYQERKAPVFVQQTDPQADEVFNRKKYKFGAEARAAGGYGFWQLAYASDGSA